LKHELGGVHDNYSQIITTSSDETMRGALELQGGVTSFATFLKGNRAQILQLLKEQDSQTAGTVNFTQAETQKILAALQALEKGAGDLRRQSAHHETDPHDRRDDQGEEGLRRAGAAREVKQGRRRPGTNIVDFPTEDNP